MEKKSKNIWKKAALAVLAIIIIALIILWSLFGNLVRTLNSIERIGDTCLLYTSPSPRDA